MVKTATNEATDPTIDSQIVSLQAAGCDTLVCGIIPRFAAQAIRKVHDLGWKPMMFMTNVSVSAGAVMQPAGPEKGVGLITSDYRKDQSDPAWANDPGMAEWRAFMAKYIADGDLSDNNYTYGYGAGSTMIQVLRQCGNDFSRENVMKQATNIAPMDIATLLPGVQVQTQPGNYNVIRQMQLQRWDGKSWVRFGKVIEGGNV
jgi:branched-chain amino acid transport system substrate-binding protein